MNVRTHLDYFHRDRAFPLIIEILSKEGYNVKIDQIKSWGQSNMSYDDILRGIKFCKDNNYGVLVYTNTVLLKERISSEHNITILDIHDLRELSTKHGIYKLNDYLY